MARSMSLLALSAHAQLHCTCPLFGGKADICRIARTAHFYFDPKADIPTCCNDTSGASFKIISDRTSQSGRLKSQ